MGGNQNKEFRGKTSIIRGGIRYIDIVYIIMIIKRKNICYLRFYALKAGEGNDFNQDYIQIVKRYMVKFGCFNKSKNNFFVEWESLQKGTGDIIQCVTGLHT